ncbi:VOC family protein [Roseibium aggregatum]|uniref:VOC family protein n=1 Tax=Roseibium aggregatum TaxID=187304 RepID=A0A926S4T3_9HYPH|nr:VOC family protein [Roseibium aggregatum]MBD1545736.1 VOC family protein [Roseibium aggregatum]
MVHGLDHVVVAVHDLDATAKAWEGLGFTVTPEARHPWGTANRLVQLDGFFIELLSVADESLIREPGEGEFSFGAFNRDFLKRREGGSMVVFESHDPDKDRAHFEKHHLKTYAPFSFEREAKAPDGSVRKVAFDLTFVTDPLAPGIGYFTCRNRFPENFWKPDYQTHANGAVAIDEIVLVANDPCDHHEFLGSLMEQREMRVTSLGLELKTPRGRIQVFTPDAYSRLFGQEAFDCLPDDLPAIAGLVIKCRGIKARKVIAGSDLFGLTLVLDPMEAGD